MNAIWKVAALTLVAAVVFAGPIAPKDAPVPTEETVTVSKAMVKDLVDLVEEQHEVLGLALTKIEALEKALKNAKAKSGCI